MNEKVRNLITPYFSGITYMASSVLCSLISFVSIPILTNILSQTEYGIITTYTSTVSLLYVFVGLALDSTVILGYKDFKNDIDDFISSIVYLSILWFMFFTLMSILICKALQLDFPTSIIIFALFHSFGKFINSIVLQKLIYAKQSNRYFLINVGLTLISVAVSTILAFYAVSNKYFYKMLGESGVYFIFLIYAVFVLIKPWNSEKNKIYWKAALTFALPHILHSASLYILNQSDRIMISSLIGFEYTAVYGVIFSFGMVPQMMATAFSNVYCPHFIENMKQEKYAQINKINGESILLSAVVTVVIMLVSPEVIKIITPNSYWSGIPMLIPIILSAFCEFIYLIFVVQEKYYNKVMMLSVATVVSAVVNISLNFLFIPYFGVVGAAYTTLIAKIVCTLMHYFTAYKLNRTTLPIFKIIVSVSFSICMSCIVYMFLENILIRWLLAIMLGCAIILILINKCRRYVL